MITASDSAADALERVSAAAFSAEPRRAADMRWYLIINDTVNDKYVNEISDIASQIAFDGYCHWQHSVTGHVEISL